MTGDRDEDATAPEVVVISHRSLADFQRGVTSELRRALAMLYIASLLSAGALVAAAAQLVR